MRFSPLIGLLFICLGGVPASAAPAKETLTPGDEFQECEECPVMVVIPAGEFIMGARQDEIDKSDEHFRTEFLGAPQVKVGIGYNFAFAKFELSVTEHEACVSEGACGRTLSERTADLWETTISSASWKDAKDYVAWLSEKTGKRYRLPSEAEWEYVSRAGTTTAYHWGDAPGRNLAAFRGCCDPSEANEVQYPRVSFEDVPIAERFRLFERTSHGSFRDPLPGEVFAPNAFGVSNTVGNVQEWVEDCWHPTLDGQPADGSAWINGNSECRWRVVRGGAYSTPAAYVRNSVRRYLDSLVSCVKDSGPPIPKCSEESSIRVRASPTVGIRVVRELSTEK